MHNHPYVTATVGSATRPYSLYRFRPSAPGFSCTIALMLVVVAGCGRSAREIDGRLQAADASTITGTVRGPEGRSPDGRGVELVNVESGERLRGSTDPTGAFSFRVKPGKYRIVLALRDGESVLRQPGVLDLNRSDAAVHADFLVGHVRLSRPRGPAYRMDDGLGSPST